MIQTISFSNFCDGFRGSYENNFSYEGKRALFDYLENLEDDIGEIIDFDPIALCCEYTEYDSAYEAMQQYQPEDMPLEGVEGDDLIEIAEKEEAKALEWLQELTQVVEVEGGGVIIQKF